MITNIDRQNTHDMLDHIFQDLLPARGMAERPEQVSLSHLMLDAILDGSIALCDAGTGIGKTYAYLAAGTVFQRFQAASGQEFRPILISTSSIALQNAVENEYLPLLSDVLMEDGLIDQPLCAVIRKGKSHYVCDRRLEKRLGQLDLSKKNWKAGRALLSLREQLDIDTAVHLNSYNRERVCVPQVCDCSRENCRYLKFLENCSTTAYPFQICNHNLLLADAIHHGTGRTPILPDACAIIIDEAHKLPDAARQMFGTTLEARDIQSLIHSLRQEKFLLAAEIAALLDACWGHALVLFTSYAAMSAIKERLSGMALPWAIRTEKDTCVIAILDERAVPGQRHFEAMRVALPELTVTDRLEDVVEFIYRAKDSGYFAEGSP